MTKRFRGGLPAANHCQELRRGLCAALFAGLLIAAVTVCHTQTPPTASGVIRLKVRYKSGDLTKELSRKRFFLIKGSLQDDGPLIEAIRKTEAIDVWYLVSLAGLFRQATRNAEALDESKRNALTRMIGTSDWQTDWYRRTRNTDLLGAIDELHARTAEVDDMEEYFGDRLRSLFPRVLPPLRLSDDRGIPQFALFFAISNPAPKAIGLAAKIAGHILNSGRVSQVRPR